MSKQPDFSARTNDTGVAPIFIERWSPRAHQEFDIDDATLTRLLDAARWSPSCFNDQPWRFYTSTKATFNSFVDLLVEGNQGWAKETSVIGFLTARKNFGHNGTPNAHAEFDCGAAWMALSLQARMEGLYTHGMAGIKFDEVAEYLKLDVNEEKVMMAFTIGKLADLESLDSERQSAEVPNNRKPLEEIWTPV